MPTVTTVTGLTYRTLKSGVARDSLSLIAPTFFGSCGRPKNQFGPYFSLDLITLSCRPLFLSKLPFAQ